MRFNVSFRVLYRLLFLNDNRLFAAGCFRSWCVFVIVAFAWEWDQLSLAY